MTPHIPIRQRRLLLQFTTSAYRQQCQSQRPCPRILSQIQAQPSPRWPRNRHNFSTSSPSLQQPPPEKPFPTYFQDAPIPATPSQLPTAPPPPPPPPPKPKRTLLRRLLFAVTFLCLGRIGGGVLERFANPPAPIPQGTHLDDLQRQRIHQLASKLDVLQALEEDPDWVSWDAYASMPESHRSHHLVTSSLAAADALGAYQRVFQNVVTGEVLVLVYFGRGVTGWPTVVHGGALATVLDETCGRAAFARLGGFEEAGSSEGEGRRRPVVTAWLKLDYLATTMERDFYLVGARVRDEEELDPSERGKGDYKAYVEGWIESVRTGEETVVAEALFVGPKPKKGESKAAAADHVGTGRAHVLPPDKRW